MAGISPEVRATVQVVARPLAWRLAANVAVAPGQDNQRIELGLGYRVLGVRGRGEEAASDGSYLEPRHGFTEHRFEGDGFSARVFELALEGRLDSRSLRYGARSGRGAAGSRDSS